MRDFNYGDINWANGTTPSQLTISATAFVQTLRALYYHQHITDPTHYRVDQHPNTLDLIITKQGGNADNIVLNSSVGKSRHLCITYDFMCYSDLPIKDTSRFQYQKGRYDSIRNEAQTVNWHDEDASTVLKRIGTTSLTT